MSDHVSSMIVEASPKQWFCAMEGHAHQDRWDWLARAQAWGPFDSSAAAAAALGNHFPDYEGDPLVRPFDKDVFQDIEVHDMVKRAQKP